MRQLYLDDIVQQNDIALLRSYLFLSLLKRASNIDSKGVSRNGREEERREQAPSRFLVCLNTRRSDFSHGQRD